MFIIPAAGVAELADALDSKSSDRKIVWVRAPPPALFVGVMELEQFERSAYARATADT